MKKNIRLILLLILLAISIPLLAWGYAPNPRETRIQSIPPAGMQLPVP